jgi:WD40 repeat protein
MPSVGGSIQFVTSGTTAPGVVAIAFSPDGTMVATAAVHYSALWDTKTGRKLRTVDPDFGTFAIAFAPKSSMLASGMWDGAVKIWRADSGQQIAELRDHEGRVNQLAFDPAGNLLASCAQDPVVKLWDVPGRREARALTGHTWSVKSVSFSPSGRLLTSGSSDGMVTVWEVGTGRNLLTVYMVDGGRDWIALDGEGHYDRSEGAERYIAWRVGDEVFTSRASEAERRRPGLVAQLLGKG